MMKTFASMSVLLAFALTPALAGDDNPGKHRGHDKGEQSLSDEPSGNSDAAGAGRWTAQDAQGGEGEAPGNPNSTQGFGTHQQDY
jgi:hypothetical protein